MSKKKWPLSSIDTSPSRGCKQLFERKVAFSRPANPNNQNEWAILATQIK